ncbi:MAG: SgcJ/EcaC family oxidoreductase [Pyrinomonadaceae bacterium]|nr:SgcJ/EcaC family oxidoreductase [Pyrinomonadaceae bacterium]
MKNIFLVITIAIFLFCGTAFAQTKQTDDEKAINAILLKAGQAWESGDMAKFTETLTDECVHVDPFGKVFTSRENIKTMLQWVRDEIYKKEKVELEITETTTKFLNADTAIVVMKLKETVKNDSTSITITETFMVSRVKNEWKISSFQGIEAKEPPKSPTK